MADDEILTIRILNLSTSGLQFACKSKISSESPIQISWKHPEFGIYQPMLMIVREVHKPENTFAYLYGAQYTNLSPEDKSGLVLLLKSLKEESKKEMERHLQEIPSAILFDAIDHGAKFLGAALESGKQKFLVNILAEIKDYEKQSFGQTTPSAICLQRLATHHFHYELYSIMIPTVIKDANLTKIYFEKNITLFKDILKTESLVEAEQKKLNELKNSDETQKDARQNLNESSNRLFYAKQLALQLIIDRFEPMVQNSELKNLFAVIKTEYEKIASNNFGDQNSQVYTRRVKPEEVEKPEAAQVTVTDLNKRPPYFLILGIFMLLVGAGIFAFIYFDHNMSKNSMRDDFNLSVKILDFERIGTQVDLVLDDGWNKLSKEGKDAELKKISAFLKKDRTAMSVVLLNSRHQTIQIVYKKKS